MSMPFNESLAANDDADSAAECGDVGEDQSAFTYVGFQATGRADSPCLGYYEFEVPIRDVGC